jgi:hypothetical protein
MVTHLWLRLNRSHLTKAEAQILFSRELGMSQVSAVFHYVKGTQIAVPGSTAFPKMRSFRWSARSCATSLARARGWT